MRNFILTISLILILAAGSCSNKTVTAPIDTNTDTTRYPVNAAKLKFIKFDMKNIPVIVERVAIDTNFDQPQPTPIVIAHDTLQESISLVDSLDRPGSETASVHYENTSQLDSIKLCYHYHLVAVETNDTDECVTAVVDTAQRRFKSILLSVNTHQSKGDLTLIDEISQNVSILLTDIAYTVSASGTVTCIVKGSDFASHMQMFNYRSEKSHSIRETDQPKVYSDEVRKVLQVLTTNPNAYIRITLQ